MKKYYLSFALFALIFTNCSKSEDSVDANGEKMEQPAVSADYNLIVSKNGMLSGTLLLADSETLGISEGESDFDPVSEPQLTFDEGKVLTLYSTKSPCSGTISIYDHNNKSSKSLDAFTDLGTCELTALSLLNSGNRIYVGYDKKNATESLEHYLRILDISGAEPVITDISLDFSAVGMAFSNNRLFVLGLDDEGSKENKITVFDAATNEKLYGNNLGFNARTIFKNPNGNIIIGYDELHTTINSATFTFGFTNYGLETAPNFASSPTLKFASDGKLYYAVNGGVNSTYDKIPAIYDFEANSAVLFAYENFLTEAQRNFEFEIENTTLVQYDEVNELILVGYKKSGGEGKGGLLRIDAVSGPKVKGNIDLDGVPFAIYLD